MTHLDLFSGIGGFALAAQMTSGIETVGFCEIDPYAQKVLAKNFPGLPIHDDIKTLNPAQYGTIEIITGGYPCQPFSHAGRRNGENDDRHLWPDVRRLIERLRPRWVLCENVVGHITMGLDSVLSDLEGLGYSARATVIPACAVGAPHRRDRVWIIANSPVSRIEGVRRWEEPTNDSERNPTLAHSDSAGLQGREKTGDIEREREGRDELSVGRSDVPGGVWSTEPGVRRVANGVPKRMDRLKGLGNAIVPQVAAEILRVILEADRKFYQ